MGVVCGILAWTTFAFGGIYPATLVVPAGACVCLAAFRRPALLQSGPAVRLDRALFVLLAAVFLQLVPIPRSALTIVSPAAGRVAHILRLVDSGGALPLSIHPSDTMASGGLLLGLLLLFFVARDIFARGGVRTTVRAIALMGLVLSAIALAQDATAHGLMYWRWRPIDEGPAPFGPFVNRNHFATWALMAAPLCIGYLTAHALAHDAASAHAAWQRKLAGWLDARTAFLVVSVILLIVALAASLSRSGMIGLASTLTCGAIIGRVAGEPARGRSSRPVILIVALGVLAIVLVLIRVGPGAISDRFAASGAAVVDRAAIWRDTLLVVRDFWLTGSGAGTYQTAMTIYQRSHPGVLFNQAHNHYLQVAAEGGLLLTVPLLFALWTFAGDAWRSVRTDRSGMFWVRVGAVSGLVGAAVQSLLETGLTTPANAALAALLAAIVIHVPVGTRHTRAD